MKSAYKAKILQGHLRPIKDIQFSNNGNFIFSASSDRNVIKWDYKNNIKCSIYSHKASVNTLCVSKINHFLFCGDSIGTIYIWNTLEGNNNKLLNKIIFDVKYNIKSINLSTNEENILITFAERAKNSSSFFEIFSIKDLLQFIPENTKDNKDILSSPNPPNSLVKVECDNLNTKFVQSRFTNLNKNILVSREDGYLQMFNYPQGILISSQKFHSDEILDFDINDENSLILTSSKDGDMSLINLTTFQLVNKFKPTNPVRYLNACKILVIENPFYNKPVAKKISIDSLFDLDNINDLNFLNSDNEDEKIKIKKRKFGNKKEIILAIVAGGQDSKFVTMTDQKEGGFDIIIYNAFTGEKLTNFLEHFGPVNTLAAYGKTLASGAEDATVRIHSLEHYLFED